MSENKTKATKGSVSGFLAKLDPDRRRDCEALVAMMKKASKAEPKMWGSAIIGFGDLHQVYESGREIDWFKIGFSPRKGDLTVYMAGGLDRHEGALAKLGKHSRGKGCLYVKRLSDVDEKVLASIFKTAVAAAK